MPDYYDHHPAESMQLQNFANFFDAEMSPGADLGMEESQFLQSTPVREPQPISPQEELVRQELPAFDVAREKKAVQKLKKGNTKPRGAGYAEWDQFDYDLYGVDPGENKKYNHDFWNWTEFVFYFILFCCWQINYLFIEIEWIGKQFFGNVVCGMRFHCEAFMGTFAWS